MNVYKITYILDGEEQHEHITERSEKAAQKRLKALRKPEEITDTELVDTEAPATKEQEREALASIRALLEELGPQSYLRTAFDGCLEDAEQNIEDDAAYSMRERYELADRRLQEEKAAHDLTKRSLEAAKEDIMAVKSEAQELREELEATKKRVMPEALRRDLWMLTTDEAEKARAAMAQAAETMAHYAETPFDIAFLQAVASYRAAKQRAEEMEQRAEEINLLGDE